MNARSALALALAASSAEAQGTAPLEVIAPDGCVTAPALRDALTRAHVDLAGEAPWRARVVARRTAPEQWLLTVDVMADRTTHDARTVDRCEGLTELSALLIRNAVPPARRDAPRPAPAATAGRVGVHATVGGALSFGMVGPVSPGLSVGAGVVLGGFRAEVDAGWYAPQGAAGSLTAPRVSALYGGLRGCFAPTGDGGPLRVDLCLAGELGAIGDLSDDDPSLPAARRSVWVAARAGARLTWRPTPRLGLWADAGLRVMLVNPPPALVREAAGAGCDALQCLDPVSSWAQPVVAAGLEVRIR